MTDPTDEKNQREPAKIDLGLHPENKEKLTGPAAEGADSSQDKPRPPKLKLDASTRAPKQPPGSQEDKDQAPKTAAPTEQPKIKLGFDESMISATPEPSPVKKAEVTPPEASTSTSQASTGDESPQDEASSKQPPPRNEEIQEESLEDLYKAALNRTQRVVLDDQYKKAAGAIDPVSSEPGTPKETVVSEFGKKSTAQVDVQEMLSDSGKIDIPEEEAAAASSVGAAQEMPNTVRISRPPAQDTSAAGDAGKSATARIDLPPDMEAAGPSTQRKTIRIKRPDAASTGAARKMTVARAQEKEGRKEPEEGETTAPTIRFDSDEDRLHTAFVIAAAAAVLISLALVYVLVATYTPNLPIPGRMI